MLFEEIDRLQKIDRFIRLNNTGTPEEFAKKLGISRRQVYYIIDKLKDIGMDIRYDRNIPSFVYSRSYHVNISFEIVEFEDNKTDLLISKEPKSMSFNNDSKHIIFSYNNHKFK